MGVGPGCDGLIARLLGASLGAWPMATDSISKIPKP